MMNKDLLKMLGQIEGRQEIIIDLLKRNTERLDNLERKSTMAGAYAGGVISVGVAVISAAIMKGLHGGP